MDAFGVPYHARSYSLPSRPNPIAQEYLCRLRSSEPTSTSTSSSSINHHLTALQDLHDCVHEFLQLPLTRQSISRASIDGFLDGSLRLLDECNIVKDALLQTKESAQLIQSVLRRRCDARAEVNNFLSTREVAKKAIQKGLKNLRNICSPVHETAAPVLGEAQAHTVLALQSLLEFINGKKMSSRSFVSKVMHFRRVASEEEEENEFAKADAAVQSLTGIKASAENVQNRLKELDLRIQDLEDGIESLFRSLIKTRVSLLNIINH